MSGETIEDYYIEWEKAITELQEKEIEQITLKDTYNQLEFEILTTFDFKKEYGKDNDKIRNIHIKTELKELKDKKNDLELRISFLKRRIEFIKSLMSMQRTLLESGMVE